MEGIFGVIVSGHLLKSIPSLNFLMRQIPAAFVFAQFPSMILLTRWWQLKNVLFSSLFGEMIQFDEHIFQMG